VRALSDPRTHGFHACSQYVETYWLAILGPSCILLARRLVSWLEIEPEGFDVSLAALARTLGVGRGVGRHAPVIRTLARLADFGIAEVDETYSVRQVFPSLSPRQIARLPDHLSAAHASDLNVRNMHS
jgi:hypothetical protein